MKAYLKILPGIITVLIVLGGNQIRLRAEEYRHHDTVDFLHFLSESYSFADILRERSRQHNQKEQDGCQNPGIPDTYLKNGYQRHISPPNLVYKQC